MPQKILFLEDDPDYGLIISATLEEGGYLVEYIDNLDLLHPKLQNEKFDLLLLDLEVQGRNSLDEIPTIRRQNPQLPIIVASSHTIGKEITQCYEAGIKCYIKKPYDFDEIEHILHTYLPDIREIGNFKLYTQTHTLSYESISIQLTPKEYQLLCILAEQPGSVITRECLFEQIWDGYIQEDSLNNLVSSLRQYLKKDKAIQIVTIKGIGYQLSVVH